MTPTFVLLQHIKQTLSTVLLAKVCLSAPLLLELLLSTTPFIVSLNWFIDGASRNEAGRHFGNSLTQSFQGSSEATMTVAWTSLMDPLLALAQVTERIKGKKSSEPINLWQEWQKKAVSSNGQLKPHGFISTVFQSPSLPEARYLISR
jgi:hypothetical protein